MIEKNPPKSFPQSMPLATSYKKRKPNTAMTIPNIIKQNVVNGEK